MGNLRSLICPGFHSAPQPAYNGRMDHDRAIKLEHLLLDLIEKKRGTKLRRFSQFEGITIDADSFENDAAAVEGLWLATGLLQE